MSNSIDISVVIGFRNWGQRRLQLAIKSIQESFGSLNGEVIVSDYGSDDGQVTREAIESSGARYIFTPTDGTWSRSRALNAGFAEARGAVLVSTDADMIFSPHSFEVIGTTLLNDPTLCLLLQCRDLPKTWGDQEVAEAGFNWDTFESVSRLRPRWGMGGMMAVHRDVYARIRGLDERMHTYGGEDIDFATRAKRAGQRLLWVDHPNARMYHMWHQPTRELIEVAQEGRDAVQYNKNIVYKDKSFVRNTRMWTHRLNGAPPLVSVAIATHNRAQYLSESITSVLGQTMQDFEIVIVDDGSTDGTREVIEQFDDPRIRYFFQEQSGVAAARNRAADESLGAYTAVHDDDDLMTPWRLQSQLDVLEAGIHGSFGSFVNFDDESGEMKLYKSRALNSGTINDSGGAPGHGTWLLETRILQRLRYDESLSSGVDNNLALRMVRSGFKFVHSGEILMMRRMHPGQITVSDEHTQKLAARQARKVFSFGTTPQGSTEMKEQRGAADWTKIRLADQLTALLPYLPDHLVSRWTAAPQLVSGAAVADAVSVSHDGQELGSLMGSGLISAAKLAKLTSTNYAQSIVAEIRTNSSDDEILYDEDPAITIRQYLAGTARSILTDMGHKRTVVVTACGTPTDVLRQLNETAVVGSSRDIQQNGTTSSYTFLLDHTGTEWVSWLSLATIEVMNVMARPTLDLSISVNHASTEAGVKA
ncbi:glycosyltransferase [Paeniglutamicibacter sulfureus]|uniref:glycosyltransferase family 2 protein n=1 Tax=Paeniglutamicibacter sulfureus TaxID=43666 RepID=UPI00266545B3|nr:glycosyltransferase [Paeniglutamicibacter sulfureus]MDO2935990.1 glycosyltransferase [Paeniglutamicibacter sulfureus]